MQPQGSIVCSERQLFDFILKYYNQGTPEE